MKIINIHTKILKAALKTPFVTSLRRVDTLEDLVIIIECDDGTVGYGEGAPTPVITGETIGSMLATIAYIQPHIIDRDIEDFNTILMNIHKLILKNTTAKSILEIALYDLKAKSSKLPLYRMLGGTKTKFRTDITISMGKIDKMISDCHSAVALGYDTLKIKIGDDPQKDVERVRAIHDALDKN
ncbi:MAG TPA: dipeptide epimerase, partial [Sulfurovum sp.]|nr:dipeptide epimerase [Sulfurovum sp.]